MNENIKVVWYVNKVRQYAEQTGKRSSKSVTRTQDTKVIMEVISARSTSGNLLKTIVELILFYVICLPSIMFKIP